MSDFSTEIKPEPQFNLLSESGINVNGVITTALNGLLKQGKVNCCETIMPAAQGNGVIFSQTEMEGKEEHDSEVESEEEKKEEERLKAEEAERARKELENKEKEKEKDKPKGKKPPKKGWTGFGSLFQEWINNATSDPEDEQNRDEQNEDND